MQKRSCTFLFQIFFSIVCIETFYTELYKKTQKNLPTIGFEPMTPAV